MLAINDLQGSHTDIMHALDADRVLLDHLWEEYDQEAALKADLDEDHPDYPM